ncbi:leukocyte surface antigen CD47-like isoform X2 [Heterocephalus glaber]|uniref:Leukocyte surface antigen CD47-like isoform X2 n=1 Tax=Heterocephalus glaber TaxID=10181 RepID=A0AAX6TGP3_HETGA|nr:leukocyte surface antigen CD47-like isoform X2 [Heterocephalus glaber]
MQLSPSHATLITQSDDTREFFVKWKFNENVIFNFDGPRNKSTLGSGFSSAKINIPELLKGSGSLHMDKDDAKLGNYTCEVTELSREGETVVELKYHSVSWFSSNECTLIVTFPIVTVFLFWGQLCFIMFKYRSNLMGKKIIILSVEGLVLIITVIFGVLFFTPGKYSKRRVCGLHFLVSPSVILVLLQFYRFTPGIGITTYVIGILSSIQLVGYIIAIIGLYLCISVCIAVHGYLLISGLIIIALVELLGLVYMIFMVTQIQPP